MINNPGATCDESHFARGVSNVTCIFASFEGFNQLSPLAQFWQYNPSRFAALPYQITDAKAMREIVSDAILSASAISTSPMRPGEVTPGLG